MNKRKGISLIVLVITILVMIILAGVVVITMQNNNPIEKGKQAQIQTNFATLRDEVGVYVANKVAEGISKKDINYTAEETTKLLGGKAGNFAGRLVVKEGELYVTVMKDDDYNVLNAGGSILLSAGETGKYAIRLAYGATKKGEYILMEPTHEIDQSGLKHHPHTFGPYMSVNSGTYTFTVEGENVDKLTVQVYNNFARPGADTVFYKVNYLEKTAQKIVFSVNVEKATKNFELRLINETYDKNPTTIRVKDAIIISGK